MFAFSLEYPEHERKIGQYCSHTADNIPATALAWRPATHATHILFFCLESRIACWQCLCAGSKAAGVSVAAVEGNYVKVAIQRQESEVPPPNPDGSASYSSPQQEAAPEPAVVVPAGSTAAEEQVMTRQTLKLADLEEDGAEEGGEGFEGSVDHELGLASDHNHSSSEVDEQEAEESDLSVPKDDSPSPADACSAAAATAESPASVAAQPSKEGEVMHFSLPAAYAAVGGSIGGGVGQRVKVSLHLERHSLNDLEVELLAAWFKV